MTPQELRARRAALIAQQRALVDQAGAENRAALTAEEEQRWDALHTEAEGIRRQYERMEALEVDERALQAAVIATTAPVAPGGAIATTPAQVRATPEYRDSFLTYIRFGEAFLSTDQRDMLRRGSEPIPAEQRAQGTGSTAGGYTIPTLLWNELIDTALRNVNVMRQLCRIITASQNTNVATTSAHGSAAWTSESNAYNESDDTFGQVTFSAYKATRIVKVNKELLQDSAFAVDAYLSDEFATSFGVLEEAAYVNGDGSSKPTGIVGGGTVGMTTASATAVTADELVDLYHSLGRRYRTQATWLASDALIKLVRKLVTGVSGDKTYLWQPGLQAGQPDTLLGRPILTSDNVPAPTASNKAIVFGDFSRYWIVQRTGQSFERLNELYAATGQVGFLGDLRVDGKLTDAAAVKIGQMHS